MNARRRIRPARPAASAGRGAFTMTEMLTATAIGALVMVGVVYLHVFGLKLATLTNSKLAATRGAREALNRVREEIRGGRIVLVGNGDGATFTPAAVNSPQAGNALQIYPSLDTNVFVRYFLDAADQSLKRKASGDDPSRVVARYITNRTVFAAENFRGSGLSSDRNNRVIRMTLDFFQWEYPVTRAGGDNYYESYRLQTRMTPRAIE
jgi:hypothetical protein